MDDAIYYQYLPMIIGYVRKVCNPDERIRHMTNEITSDCKSLAYVYYASLHKRFYDDPTAANKYYLATVTRKISDHIAHFYLCQNSEWYKKDKYTTILFLSFDEDRADDGDREFALVNTLIAHDSIDNSQLFANCDQEIYQLLINALINCAPLRRRHLVNDLFADYIDYLDQSGTISICRKAGNSIKIAKKHNTTKEIVHRTVALAKAKFKMLYPEAVEYLRTQDPDLIPIILQKFNVEKLKNIL